MKIEITINFRQERMDQIAIENERRFTCAKCDYEQNEVEEASFYIWGGEIVCDDCVDNEISNLPSWELRERMGAEMVS